MSDVVFDSALKAKGLEDIDDDADSLPQNVFSYTIPQSNDNSENIYVVLTPSEEEGQDILRDELEYHIDKSNPALVVIFNMEKFDKESERKGSSLDVQELIYALTRQKIFLEREYICDNLDRKDVLQKIEKICNDINIGIRNPSSLISIFLTHGRENDTLCCTCGTMLVSEVYGPFAACEKLKGKPKLFIFQACKSTLTPIDNQENYQIDETSQFKTKPLVSENFWKLDIPEDTIIAYSTLENEVSVRMEKAGSWFIQEFCKNVHAYARRDDVHSILLRTNKCITANHNYVVDGKILFKQMPIFVSTLRKKWFLNMSQDRQSLLRTKKALDELNKNIRF